jgi:hypothetical protein
MAPARECGGDDGERGDAQPIKHKHCDRQKNVGIEIIRSDQRMANTSKIVNGIVIMMFVFRDIMYIQ